MYNIMQAVRNLFLASGLKTANKPWVTFNGPSVHTVHKDKNIHVMFPQESIAIINMATVEMFVIPGVLTLKKIALQEIVCIKR